MKRHLRPCSPLFKRPGAMHPSFHRSPTSLKLPMIYYVRALVPPFPPRSKGRGEVPPSCIPVPASLRMTVAKTKFQQHMSRRKCCLNCSFLLFRVKLSSHKVTKDKFRNAYSLVSLLSNLLSLRSLVYSVPTLVVPTPQTAAITV